jgi:hypothetical protein
MKLTLTIDSVEKFITVVNKFYPNLSIAKYADECAIHLFRKYKDLDCLDIEELDGMYTKQSGNTLHKILKMDSGLPYSDVIEKMKSITEAYPVYGSEIFYKKAEFDAYIQARDLAN